IVALAREWHLGGERAWPGGAGNAMRFFEQRPAARHPPDEQSVGRQTGVEALGVAVFEQEVLAAVGTDEHLEALLRRRLHGRQDQLLLGGRVDRDRLEPTELFLAPGAHVLRPAV